MASTRFCAAGGYAVCHARCGKEKRCRWGGKASQVCVFGVTCNANRPYGQKSVAGPTIFSDLRHFGWSPATFWVVTCDSRGHHLQRFGLLPATVGAITCDTYSPWALASSQMASICARVRSRKESPLRRVCSSRYVKRRRNFSELRLRAVSGSTP